MITAGQCRNGLPLVQRGRIRQTTAVLDRSDPPGGFYCCKWVHREISQCYVEDVLRRFRGNVTQAARHAKIPRQSFHRIMRKFGIKAADMKGGDRG